MRDWQHGLTDDDSTRIQWHDLLKADCHNIWLVFAAWAHTKPGPYIQPCGGPLAIHLQGCV